jgi:phosphate transport system substrate-binding protein
LKAALLHTDLTQNLTNVYTNPVANAYPLSFYSYLITPCSPTLAEVQGTTCDGMGASTFSKAKGFVLGRFIGFAACAGQQQMTALGYAPLPENLVQDDFKAIGRLPGGVQPPAPTPANCPNPTIGSG